MKKSAILSAVIIGLFSFIFITSAADYTPLAPLPIGEGGSTPGSYNMSTYLSGALKLLIALGGALSILMAIIGGTQYVASGIAPAAKNDAKVRIANAFIGLALVLTSYLILNSINPALVSGGFSLPSIGVAPITNTATTGTAGTQAPLLGGANPFTQAPSSNSTYQPPSGLTPAEVVAAANAQAQAQINAQVDQTNDYSIIKHCLTVPTYSLCPKADLNNDGKTDSADFMLFVERGGRLDLNGDKKIDSNPASTPTSCFIKTSTANIRGMLPSITTDNNGNILYVCGANGITAPPTSACGGADGWLKYSVIGGACAAGSGLLNMPFGYVYTANGTSPGEGGIDGQYSNFKIWINDASSGGAVNLATLFVKTFLSKPHPLFCLDCGPQDPYLESNLGKVTYATIAQYDLNNDGTADFSAGGADMAAFNACKGSAVSGACAQADFNRDGTIDNHDLMLRDFIVRDIYSQPTSVLMGDYTSETGVVSTLYGQSFSFVPYHWLLDQFESMFFDPTRYTDKQIAKYCVGHKPFDRCAVADVDGSCHAQYLSCGVDMTCRAQAESCAVDTSDVTKFDAGATQLDLNGDGKVDLQ